MIERSPAWVAKCMCDLMRWRRQDRLWWCRQRVGVDFSCRHNEPGRVKRWFHKTFVAIGPLEICMKNYES